MLGFDGFEASSSNDRVEGCVAIGSGLGLLLLVCCQIRSEVSRRSRRAARAKRNSVRSMATPDGVDGRVPHVVRRVLIIQSTFTTSRGILLISREDWSELVWSLAVDFSTVLILTMFLYLGYQVARAAFATKSLVPPQWITNVFIVSGCLTWFVVLSVTLIRYGTDKEWFQAFIFFYMVILELVWLVLMWYLVDRMSKVFRKVHRVLSRSRTASVGGMIHARGDVGDGVGGEMIRGVPPVYDESEFVPRSGMFTEEEEEEVDAIQYYDGEDEVEEEEDSDEDSEDDGARRGHTHAYGGRKRRELRYGDTTRVIQSHRQPAAGYLSHHQPNGIVVAPREETHCAKSADGRQRRDKMDVSIPVQRAMSAYSAGAKSVTMHDDRLSDFFYVIGDDDDSDGDDANEVKTGFFDDDDNNNIDTTVRAPSQTSSSRPLKSCDLPSSSGHRMPMAVLPPHIASRLRREGRRGRSQTGYEAPPRSTTSFTSVQSGVSSLTTGSKPGRVSRRSEREKGGNDKLSRLRQLMRIATVLGVITLPLQLLAGLSHMTRQDEKFSPDREEWQAVSAAFFLLQMALTFVLLKFSWGPLEVCCFKGNTHPMSPHARMRRVRATRTSQLGIRGHSGVSVTASHEPTGVSDHTIIDRLRISNLPIVAMYYNHTMPDDIMEPPTPGASSAGADIEMT